ncbi:hypothetical protein B0H19DRAFT_1079473 [Mycena capillaripes]|nr:hypothetical protein B0H19DRAFT_1079473 [Mycena capillaripes]
MQGVGCWNDIRPAIAGNRVNRNNSSDWFRRCAAPPDLQFEPSPGAARRARRAGSTGPVRRVADPFRQGFWKFFDGTVTGRLLKTTAVEITAVDGGRRAMDFCTANRRISHISNMFRAFLFFPQQQNREAPQQLKEVSYISQSSAGLLANVFEVAFQRELPANLQLTRRLISLAAELATSAPRRRPSRHPSRAVDIFLAYTTERWVTGRSRCTPVETTAVPVTGTAVCEAMPSMWRSVLLQQPRLAIKFPFTPTIQYLKKHIAMFQSKPLLIAFQLPFGRDTDDENVELLKEVMKLVYKIGNARPTFDVCTRVLVEHGRLHLADQLRVQVESLDKSHMICPRQHPFVWIDPEPLRPLLFRPPSRLIVRVVIDLTITYQYLTYMDVLNDLSGQSLTIFDRCPRLHSLVWRCTAHTVSAGPTTTTVPSLLNFTIHDITILPPIVAPHLEGLIVHYASHPFALSTFNAIVGHHQTSLEELHLLANPILNSEACQRASSSHVIFGVAITQARRMRHRWPLQFLLVAREYIEIKMLHVRPLRCQPGRASVSGSLSRIDSSSKKTYKEPSEDQFPPPHVPSSTDADDELAGTKGYTKVSSRVFGQAVVLTVGSRRTMRHPTELALGTRAQTWKQRGAGNAWTWR